MFAEPEPRAEQHVNHVARTTAASEQCMNLIHDRRFHQYERLMKDFHHLGMDECPSISRSKLLPYSCSSLNSHLYLGSNAKSVECNRFNDDNALC